MTYSNRDHVTAGRIENPNVVTDVRLDAVNSESDSSVMISGRARSVGYRGLRSRTQLDRGVVNVVVGGCLVDTFRHGFCFGHCFHVGLCVGMVGL